MKNINIYYISVAAIGIFLWSIYSNQNKNEVSFFGFAETRETEINYNHPVLVNKIFVVPGQSVKKGELLLNISRIKSKETLQDQQFIINEINSKIAKWNADKTNDITILEGNYNIEVNKLNQEIKRLENELTYKIELAKALDNNLKNTSQYPILKLKIEDAKSKKTSIGQQFEIEKKAIEIEKRKGAQPFYDEIKHVEADKQFEEDHLIQYIEVLAPSDGLIGNIQCKAAEHITAYKTLLSFYEPNPSYIKAYVHENLIVSVANNDKFIVRSIKNPDYKIEGIVTGLGSRIIEIPERLRKMPDLKSYGREVTLKINPDNSFLQKEKVALDLILGLKDTPLASQK